MNLADTLSKPDVHEAWIKNIRHHIDFTPLEKLLQLTGLKAGAEVLDAGCGTGTNSRWLVRQGFKVTGADFSEFALDKAGSIPNVRLVKADLTNLPFGDNSFDAVCCLGVLMHIPDVETALNELARVLRPGGWLVISETNARAPETYAFRLYWRLRGLHRVKATPRGVEVWSETSAGPLLSRKMSARWLKRYLTDLGLLFRARTTGELTELYMYGLPLRALNRLWARLNGPPSLAIGNYFLFRK